MLLCDDPLEWFEYLTTSLEEEALMDGGEQHG